MIGFEAPLWLLLLGLVPLLRWLHRFRRQAPLLPSTTLFLWRGLQPDTRRHGAADKPDPRWLLRALICSLLILALAGPQQQGEQQLQLEVWVDDSLSMFTREAGQSRMQAALRQLQSYLATREFARIRLHSLGAPGSTLSLDPRDHSAWQARLQAWAGQPRAEPAPPPTLPRESSHILVTDGADRALNRWAQHAPLALVINSGERRQNLALSRLNIREPLVEATPVTGSLRVDNLGDLAQRARLVIEQGQDPIATVELDIAPQDFSTTTFALDSGARGALRARLLNDSDALPDDDSLELDPAARRVTLRYTLHGDCAAPVVAVLNSHPALVEAAAAPDLLIDCAAQALDSPLPTLRLHPTPRTRRTTQSAHWHRQLSPGYLPLAAGLVYGEQAPALATSAAPLLSANERVLIGLAPGQPRVIDCYLDTGAGEFAHSAQYPLLLLGLIGYLGGHSLDLAPLTVSRDIEASRILPLPISAGRALPAPPPAPAAGVFTSLILFGVLVLLLLDAALWLRAARAELDWQA